jgi:RNA polymerase sigma factor (sigma-70 family)
MSPDCKCAVAGSLCRVRRWKCPPNWSPSDWMQEMHAVCAAAAVEAQRAYEPSRGVPLHCFLRSRTLAAALTRYRQEWSFAVRCIDCDSGPEALPECSSTDPRPSETILCALSQLPDSDQKLIRRLYWEGTTEREIARECGVTQQAISKRKTAALHTLRITMGALGY